MSTDIRVGNIMGDDDYQSNYGTDRYNSGNKDSSGIQGYCCYSVTQDQYGNIVMLAYMCRGSLVVASL
jgi:hypothetical protein